MVPDFLRSYADDLPLHEWLERQVFPNEAKLAGDDVYWLNILGIMEYLTSGITSNFDMYIQQKNSISATVDTAVFKSVSAKEGQTKQVTLSVGQGKETASSGKIRAAAEEGASLTVFEVFEPAFRLKPFSFKHTGLFPEQATNWDWFGDLIRRANRPVKVLNLFAYTGGATLAAAAAGASVTHVDASKGMVNWAKENAAVSGLSDKPIRWLHPDNRSGDRR